MRTVGIVAVFAVGLPVWVGQAGCSDDGYRGRVVDDEGRAVGGCRWNVGTFCTNAVYGQGESYIDHDDFSDHGTTAGDGTFAVGVPSDVCPSSSVAIDLFCSPGELLITVPAPRHSIMFPDLPLWSPDEETVDTADETTIQWTPVPSLVDSPSYTVFGLASASGGSSGGSLWLGGPVSDTGLTLDRRLLQDWTFDISIQGGGHSSLGVGLTWRAWSAVQVHGDRVPLSRGAACSAIDVAGGRLDFPAGECPATSGSVTGVIEGLSSDVGAIIVDLGAVTTFQAVTLQPPVMILDPDTGGVITVAVSVSDDCATFAPIAATPTDPSFPALLDAPGSGRCVRLDYPSEPNGLPYLHSAVWSGAVGVW